MWSVLMSRNKGRYFVSKWPLLSQKSQGLITKGMPGTFGIALMVGITTETLLKTAMGIHKESLIGKDAVLVGLHMGLYFTYRKAIMDLVRTPEYQITRCQFQIKDSLERVSALKSEKCMDCVRMLKFSPESVHDILKTNYGQHALPKAALYSDLERVLTCLNSEISAQSTISKLHRSLGFQVHTAFHYPLDVPQEDIKILEMEVREGLSMVRNMSGWAGQQVTYDRATRGSYFWESLENYKKARSNGATTADLGRSRLDLFQQKSKAVARVAIDSTKEKLTPNRNTYSTLIRKILRK